MNSSSIDVEGPRLVRREELVWSIRLFRQCFGGPEIEDEQQIPDSVAIPKRGGTYALVQEGRPVSQIVIFHDQIKMYDGTIRAGSIGGVCTHPDLRDRGLASRLLEHCAGQLRKEGATLMLISGARGIYTRLGNVFHGSFTYFTVRPGQGNREPSPSPDLVVRRATPADALRCSQLHQAEPVHFVRHKSDFKTALENPQGNTYLHSDMWVIERGGQAAAYMFLGVPYEQEASSGIRHVSEYAGSRTALAEAIPLILRAGNLEEVAWPVPWQDRELFVWLQKKDYKSTVAPLDGHTLRILNFPAFMKDLRPLLLSRLDTKLMRGLRFEQSGPLLGGTENDRYAIVHESERLELDGAGMTYLVMGNAGAASEEIHGFGALAEIISVLFPLPSFLPGLNYH